MTSTLYLIAHSVRGEAAFDVALQMECPHCHGNSACKVCGGSGFTGPHNYDGICSECAGQSAHGCPDCDSLGYWWIISTSGHRAFPYWHTEINELMYAAGMIVDKPMPPGWPDHYHHGPAPSVDIMSLFKAQRPVQPHIPRRL